MSATEPIIKSCYLIANVSCYEVTKDFSGLIISILIAYFTITFAFKQLKKQHQNTIDAQKEESKRSTKIELFKEINQLLEVSGTVIREVNSYCMGKKYSTPNMISEIGYEEYLGLMNKFGQALLAIISKVETHEIINPKLFKVFRYSLQATHHDLLGMQFLENRVQVLENFIYLTGNAQYYLSDFQVCMQNMAYGEIFETKISHRVTIDKSFKVIVDDPVKLDKLMTYFLKETNWGKNCTKYENEALQIYHS